MMCVAFYRMMGTILYRSQKIKRKRRRKEGERRVFQIPNLSKIRPLSTCILYVPFQIPVPKLDAQNRKNYAV